jgi:hypothetical protein
MGVGKVSLINASEIMIKPSSKLKNITKRIVGKIGSVMTQGCRADLLEQHEDIRSRLGKLESQISNLTYESNLLYRQAFHQDPWLAQAKDKHKGQRCFILATGPSLNKTDLSKIRNELTFGVNGTYKIPDLNLTYFVYVSLWYLEHHLDGLKNVRCERRFYPSIFPELESAVPTSWLNVHFPRYHSPTGKPLPVPTGFSHQPDRYIFAGGTVLFLCLQLAYHFGCREVILLGVDHTYGKDDDKAKRHGGTYIQLDGKDQSHFDSSYVPENISYPVDLRAMEHGYEMARKVFAGDGRRIINASPGTMLTTYPTVAYDDLFG